MLCVSEVGSDFLRRKANTKVLVGGYVLQSDLVLPYLIDYLLAPNLLATLYTAYYIRTSVLFLYTNRLVARLIALQSSCWLVCRLREIFSDKWRRDVGEYPIYNTGDQLVSEFRRYCAAALKL